ncbi:MAG: spermidine/putrescine ABC transporter substrate-binding protein [Oscillospiraceae bacterium]
MKKFFSIILSAILVCGMSFSAFALDDSAYKKSDLAGTTLNVYNWGEYISDGAEGTLNVNKKFEELTGIKVNYTNFDSNEDMYGKLKSGGASYDIIIPSDYMIERLEKEKMLVKLDFSNIPNYKYIDKKYKDLFFDKNNEYSVPYAVGMVGLIYNTKMVDKAPTSWDVMWDEKYSGQILMFNNPRDAFAIAQFLLKQNVNSTKEDDWNLALDKLKEQKPLIKSYVMDDVFNIMERNGAAIAPYYAGDFLTMKTNNPDLAFVYPKEGTNTFVDSICIPSTCQNKAAAELYINFLLEPEIALANAETIRYASPHTEVVKMDEYTLKDNEVIYPKDAKVYENVQYFENLPPETLALMSDLWNDLKIEGNSNTSIYIGVGVVVVAIAGYAIFKAVQKKKREEA